MRAIWVMALALPLAAAPGAVRRLTHNQYNNTVRDLLGDQTRPADRFPAEDYVNGFRNQTSAQDVPPLLAQAYANAAERLARTAFLGGRDDNRLIPCQPRSASDAVCANRFVRTFGARAFRRALTAAEARRYAALLLAEARRTGEFVRGAQALVEAMLQSPKFLFRIDESAASRLSYLLWETMPGPEPAGPDEAAVRRMLEDPRARAGLDEFVSQWLRFDLALNAVKDRRLFPQFNGELAAAMAEETRRGIADVVWNDRDFMTVFTADYGFPNPDLATLYKVAAPAGEFTRTPYPAGRAGLLGQALFLALTSKPGETSPTSRGFFVREHFLCQQVPDPPPGTNSSLPPLTPERPLTARQRLSEHVSNAACAGCHQLMDPIGFGLEGFDAVGQLRTTESITFFPVRETRNERPKTVALPLDTRGLVAGLAAGSFSGPLELGRLLAASRECQECVVKQWFRYAAGRRETGADSELLKQAGARFRDSGFRLKELMVFLATRLAWSETNAPAH